MADEKRARTYKSISLVAPTQGPIIQAGDRYLQNATSAEGFRITREGDFYTIGHGEWNDEVLELHASRVAGAIPGR